MTQSQIEQIRVNLETGDIPAVEVLCLEILNRSPDDVDAIFFLGMVRMHQDRFQEAIEMFLRAIETDPRRPEFHFNLGGAYRSSHQLIEAEAAYAVAIELQPDYGKAFHSLANIVRFKPDDPLIARAAQQVKRLDLHPEIKCLIHFALGKMYDDIGEYELAFKHYRWGNNDSGRRFDSATHRRKIKDTLYIFSDYCLRSLRDEGLMSDMPVFVVGMPRSGTSLIEQILDSHSMVFGAGELSEIKDIAVSLPDKAKGTASYPNCMPLLTTGQLAAAAYSYLNNLTQLADDASVTRVIDKHPLNFQYVGLILKLFPNAKIIHARRDPLDTCLSCYFQHFNRGQNYSFELRALGNSYNDYRRLMEHWQSRHAESILNIDYESLVENPERESKRMLAFCGLDWEDRCLEFYRSERVVKTASFLQVRQPIYQRSRRRWTHYRQHMKGLAASLGIDLQSH